MSSRHKNADESTHGNQFEAYINRGDAHYRAKHFEEAIESYEKAIQCNPNKAEAYVGKGNSHLELGEYELALQSYVKAIDFESKSTLAYNGMYYLYIILGGEDQAYTANKKSIGMMLQDIVTCIAKEKSSEETQSTLERKDRTLVVQLEEGKVYFSLHHYTTALQIFDKVLWRSPGYAHAHTWIGTTLVELGRFEEGLQSLDSALKVQPHSLTYASRGKALRKLGRYTEALQALDEAIRLDAKLTQVSIEKGHVLVALYRSEEASKSYSSAMNLITNDLECYFHSGNRNILVPPLPDYKQTLEAYNIALTLDKSLIPIHLARGNILFELERYNEALETYTNVIEFDARNPIAHWRMADILSILHRDNAVADTYQKALEVIRAESDLEVLWFIFHSLQTSLRPTSIQLELFQYFALHAHSDVRISQGIESIAKLYDKLFDAGSISSEQLDLNIQMLQTLLIHIPEKKRSEALTCIAQGNNFYLAHLLICLAPFSLLGLDTLAHELTFQWTPTSRTDDLGVCFYHVLDSYHVPVEDADWLYARELMLEGLYNQAKVVLASLVEQWPTADHLWLFARAKSHSNDLERDRIDILRKFIKSAVPSDMRRGEAWHQMGDLLLQIEEGTKAIEAFEEAERYGYVIPQLQDFRAGNWGAIPALHLHADYAFPTVVVIDLESDYQPKADPGSSVFEIGAVRMKGRTELAHCVIVIQRDFISPKVAQRQKEAIEPEQAIRILQEFIGTSLVVGHNIQEFDAVQLRAMGLNISDDQLIDTLTFARLLYPDSLHHNLALLCQKHHIIFEGDEHTALPDARACAHLLLALGDELESRGEQLLAGFRAFVPPDSAFDKAILQPRDVPANSLFSWSLNQEPNVPHILMSAREGQASPKIIDALEQKNDALIERYDSSGKYVQHLSLQQRTIVVVHSQARLERMLAQAQEKLYPLVLSDPHTLLCPRRLHKAIEQAQSWQMKLTLFCLYQASHNHDARTLYPLRLPSDDVILIELKQVLLGSCCSSDCCQGDTCPAIVALEDAINGHQVILATHESFLHQPRQPEAEIIIIDDVDKLQMHFSEYVAQQVTSEQIRIQSKEASQMIDESMKCYIQHYLGSSAFYEKVPLQDVAAYFTQPQQGHEQSLLHRLKALGPAVIAMAETIETLCQQACETPTPSEEIHAYWLELHISRESLAAEATIGSWRICGVHMNIANVFHEFFWKPYQQHILCGTAITLGKSETTFLTRFFGLPDDIEYQADKRPPTAIYIPLEGIQASFLARSKWAKNVGDFLYQLTKTKRDAQSLVVSLQATPIANALAEAFQAEYDQLKRQVLSTSHGWTTSKIRERLADRTRATMAFISPRLRETVLDDYVEIEASGPLHFLNQQDPLVAAHMRLFKRLFPNENPFSSYLLPQALLELKTRMSSSAKIHIILDSGLNSKVYRDEVKSLFQQDKILETLPKAKKRERTTTKTFTSALASNLERCGLSLRTDVDDATLHLALQTYWSTESFRETPLNQKEIVRKTLNGEDQLVIAATGGGKSLCFQLPAILMAQDNVPKVTLVITPLIALMKDQIEVLQTKGVFSAIVWNSTISHIEKQKYREGIKKGWYSIIYIAPEQIRTSSLRTVLALREIGLIAIDEAHCVSQWGHNFRTDYFALKQWIETHLCSKRSREFPILALTATARAGYKDAVTGSLEQGTTQDIIERLGLEFHNEQVEMPSLERPELEFSVEHIAVPCPYCKSRLISNEGEVKCPACGRWCEIEKEQITQAKQEKLVALLSGVLRERWDRPYQERQRGLIYCAYRKTTEEIAMLLRTLPRMAGLRVAAYHGGMLNEHKENVYSSFICDDEKGLDIVVATNAFGMGIDVRRLGFVIHFDIPGTLEAYIQEAGRAGRDAEFQRGEVRAKCILLYHESDLGKQSYLNKKSKIGEEDITNVFQALQKCRRTGQKEVLISTEEIEQLTCIEEQRIKTILYYLEWYTRAKGKRVLERGEDSSRDWEFAFEYGYQQRLENTELHPLSQQLINVFQTSEEFGLLEGIPHMVSANELAEYLGWEMGRLKDERDNLIRNQLIVQPTPIYIQWNMNKKEVKRTFKQMLHNLSKLLGHINSENGTITGSLKVTIDMQELYDEDDVFLHFLPELAHVNIDGLHLFKSFQGVGLGPHRYQLQLKRSYELRPILQNLREGLQQTIDRFFPCIPGDDKQRVDLLEIELEYERRQQLRRHFILLKELGVLSLLVDPCAKQHGSALQIIFQQDHVSEDQLDINLTRLRLVERHNERKLELMKEYAMLSPELRMILLHSYFSGATPLLEAFKINPVLSEQQQSIVTLSNWYHLIEGPAGSGKTRILKEHVRYLVEHELVPHDHILVLTHYNSAVDHISNDVNDYRNRGKSISAQTLNNLGESIFQNHRELLLRPDGRPYYAAKRSVQLLKRSWQENDRQELQYVREVLTQMRQEEQYTVSSSLHRVNEQVYWQDIKRVRHYGLFPKSDIDLEVIGQVLRTDDQEYIFILHEVYSRFLLIRGSQGIYTYDDQILFPLAILQAYPHIAITYQRLYEHIIIDEFQDFTVAQNKLIRILSKKHRNVLAFGDDTQDIRIKEERKQEQTSLSERFKHSFGEIPNSHHLTINYRSVQEILDLANAVRSGHPTTGQVAANGKRGEKPIVIRIHSSTISQPNNNESDKIREMVDETLHQISFLPACDTGSIALMVARAKSSSVVEDYLREYGVTYSLLGRSPYQSWHVKPVLSFYRLIIDSLQDVELEHLLYFSLSCLHVGTLKRIAQQHGQPLIDIVLNTEVREQINVLPEQEELLMRQLAIIQKFDAHSYFEDVWQEISELPSGPLALNEEGRPEKEELDTVLKNLHHKTVAEALEHIDSHLTFVEEHRTNQQLIVTSIDNAKSQAFDTVFLLGADSLKMASLNDKARLYVSVSRARQRLFFLVAEQLSEGQGNNTFLAGIPKELYQEIGGRKSVEAVSS